MVSTITELNGENELISIGAMAKLSGVSASALRGYESLGEMAKYGVIVIRKGKARYYRKQDSWKIAQIKATRLSRRNTLLGAQASRDENY